MSSPNQLAEFWHIVKGLAEELNMAEHEWVRHMITPVDVVPDPLDDQAVIVIPKMVTDDDIQEAVYGCKNCNIPLNASTSTTICEGDVNAEG